MRGEGCRACRSYYSSALFHFGVSIGFLSLWQNAAASSSQLASSQSDACLLEQTEPDVAPTLLVRRQTTQKLQEQRQNDVSRLTPRIAREPFRYDTYADVPPSLVATDPTGATSTATCGDGDHVKVRPQAGCGIDTVMFGLYAKTFYGVHLKDYAFDIDVIMTLRWSDKRAAALIPGGNDKFTMSGADAKASMWLPEVRVTNRAIRKEEIISTSVTISANGTVEKVERVLVTAHCKFNLVMYPFDEQDLTVRIASTKHMLDEVVLAPIKEVALSGMSDNFFDGAPYESVANSLDTITDVDGSLKKSRGLLVMQVKRKFGKYFDEFLVPAMLITSISWGVFFFPYTQAFVTPRLALSILALLTFTSQAQKIDNQMPPGAPQTWHQTFCQVVQVTMFLGIGLNIFIEAVFYQLEIKDLAARMNNDAKLLIPLLAIVAWIFSFVSSDLSAMKLSVYSWLAGAFGLYLLFRLPTLFANVAAKNKEARIKEFQAQQKESRPLHHAVQSAFHTASEALHGAVGAPQPASESSEVQRPQQSNSGIPKLSFAEM